MTDNLFYHPLTATPFLRDSSYTEIPPCRPLRSHIRCFWGTAEPVLQTADAARKIVIPDTCADIIYHIDHTEHTVSGFFCGINDCSFYSHPAGKSGHLVSTFAIRFYAWSAYAFSEDSLKATLNSGDEIERWFAWLDRALRPGLTELKTLREKAFYAEQLFLCRADRMRENAVIDRTVRNILAHKGSLDVAGLAGEAFVSSRQLERLFQEYVGVPPKKLSSLIRYQLLWRDILCRPDFNIPDAVCRYGYTDQSHLLREFKRYHSMDIHSAKSLARQGRPLPEGRAETAPPGT